MVRSVFLGVTSQPRNPRRNNGLVSPATEVSLEIEKPPFWKRRPEGRLPPPSAQPSSLLFRNPLLVSLNNSQDLLFPPKPFSPSHLSRPPWSSFFPWESYWKRSWAERGGGRGRWTTEGRWQRQTKGINTLIKWPRKTGGEDGSGGEGGGKR